MYCYVILINLHTIMNKKKKDRIEQGHRYLRNDHQTDFTFANTYLFELFHGFYRVIFFFTLTKNK